MTSKFKGNIIVNNIKIKCLFELTNHFLKIGIINDKNMIKADFELIKALLISINYTKNFEFLVNYAFINNIKSHEKNNIIIEINNPVAGNIFSFLLNNLEGISVLFKKKLDINQLITQIKKKIKEEIKFLIYGLNNMIFALKNFVEKTKKIKILENIKKEAYKFGKQYYEKAALTFKKNTKIAKNIKDNILLIKLKTLEQSLPQQAKMKKNISYTSFESLIGEINIRTNYFIDETTMLFLKIICIGINSFDDINFNKFNLNQIFENNKEELNLQKSNSIKNNKSFTYGINTDKNNIINNEEDMFNKLSQKNNINQIDDVSTEGTSKKKKASKKIYINQNEPKVQTPKFKQFNYKIQNNPSLDNFTKNYYNNLNNKITISINPLENINNIAKNIVNKKISTLNGLNKEIEELCNVHSLVVPDNIFNLFCNAAEIIHRKFFQMTINNYLGNIFYLEEDKEGNIKIEDLYNYFMYIRALKLMHFNSDKKEYFMNNILNKDIMI